MDKPCWIRSSKGLHGPYNPDLLTKLAEGGLLKPDMDISTDGHTWHRADTLPGLFVASRTTPPATAIAKPGRAANTTNASGTPASDANPQDIERRIEALSVSDTWKRRFRQLETRPDKPQLNLWAFLFGASTTSPRVCGRKASP